MTAPDPTALRLAEPLALLPLDTILAEALPRDRGQIDEDALGALTASIVATGLRQPIEVWALQTPREGCTHGLISGQRRLMAFRRIRASRDGRDHTHIPCFIRRPETVAEAMQAMIAENELRAELSPWEKGRILVDAVAEGIFETLDAAVTALHPHASQMARSRLRALAQVADTFYNELRAPEGLSQRQLLRLATAIRADFAPLVITALQESSDKSPERQWALIEPIVSEAEEWLRNPEPVSIPGRPLRVLRPRGGLTVRREKTADGWSIHFTGPEAHGFLVTSVMEEIERQYR